MADTLYLVGNPASFSAWAETARRKLGFSKVENEIELWQGETRQAFGMIAHPTQPNLVALAVTAIMANNEWNTTGKPTLTAQEVADSVFPTNRPLKTYSEMESDGWFTF